VGLSISSVLKGNRVLEFYITTERASDFSRARWKSFWAILIGLIAVLQPLSAEDLLRSNFDNATEADNPWAGVSSTGVLAVTPGMQPAVNDAGEVKPTKFGPGVAVGDLNGDGLPDLVISDAYGYFWFYPNSGTALNPKFTQGELIPVWFGVSAAESKDEFFSGGAENIIPKAQLVNLSGDGRMLDLVVGTYKGQLFYVHNLGSTQQPQFKITPSHLHDFVINTHTDGLLWCNYLSPCLYDWFGTGNLDLIMGDGSYSANSIFMFKNQGGRGSPLFNENGMAKIIPGMGLEDLTPQVVDWNNDGKPDIICGDRTGHITLFLNTSEDPKQPVPTFAPGQQIKLGSKDDFGDMTSVTVCDLTGNKLPNLIITNAAGDILYAQNTGKLGAPQFGDPVPIHGTNPYPKILRPKDWTLRSPYGVVDELLVTTNATVQPGFAPPSGTPLKSALRYYVFPVTGTKYFLDSYNPGADAYFDDTHIIKCTTTFPTTENTPYRVSFWIRTTGQISNLKCTLFGYRNEPGEDDGLHIDGSPGATQPVSAGSSWSFFDSTFKYTFATQSKKDALHESGTTNFTITFNGQGEVYLDDVSVQPAP